MACRLARPDHPKPLYRGRFCTCPEAPFSEKQQGQSKYDGGLEDDGVTRRTLVPTAPEEPSAHIARMRRSANQAQHFRRNDYKEVPLTGCQLCTAPHYLLPHSFGQECVVEEEGDVHDTDTAQLAEL